MAERHSLRINAIFFRYARLANGGKILARSVLVAESVMPAINSTRKMSEAMLIGMAAAHKTSLVLEFLRALAKIEEEVAEMPSRTFGGSFRYCRRDTENQWRMLFGANVSAKRFNAPEGQLDIWIPVANLRKVFGVSEKQAQTMLRKLEIYKMHGRDCIIRVRDQRDAQMLVKQLQE